LRYFCGFRCIRRHADDISSRSARLVVPIPAVAAGLVARRPLGFFIAETVAALNLPAFYAPYEGDGRRNQPFDPQMMVTVLVYAG